MIRLFPFVSEKIWGYENWLVSTHPAGLSFAEDAAGRKLTLPAALGRAYPLLVKVIQTRERLSVQVHPGDGYARAHEAALGECALGKTECWYVLGAESGAVLAAGLKPGVTRHDVALAVAENRLEPLLCWEEVSAGDFVYIPSGLVHGIGKGIRLLEAQQASDITYRLYDWGRGRELNLKKALDVLLEESSPVRRGFSGRFESPFFCLETWEAGEHTCEAGTVVVILEGEGEIRGKDGAATARPEDAFLCKTPETLNLSGNTRALKIVPGLNRLL
jgi:mannose-6-phosphate isomerase